MLSVIEGKVWKFGNNISTDNLMPGFSHAGNITKPELYCMNANRPEFGPNVKKGDIVVGGRNFGCGSSRPAARNLIALGVSCVIAESFGRIFFRNTVSLGFPLLYCNGLSEGVNDFDQIQVNFDTGTIKNLTTGKTLKAEPLPEVAMRILNAGGVMNLLKAEYSKK